MGKKAKIFRMKKSGKKFRKNENIKSVQNKADQIAAIKEKILYKKIFV